MSENSKIEWCHHTFNPWWGCLKIGPGCDNCYAERDSKRFAGDQILWGENSTRRLFGDSHWRDPLKWDRKAKAAGVRHRVFCASMADVFDNAAPSSERERLFELIKATPNLDWLLLTKRIGNAKKMFPADWGNGYPNVWLGITVVNQEEAERDIPKLLATPTLVRWLSMEPLLGPVDFTGMWVNHENPAMHENMLEKIDWVVVGGESGPGARPMYPDWVRILRDQCESLEVPFLFKQWGEWAPENAIEVDGSPLSMTWQNNAQIHICDKADRVYRVGKKRAGRLLDGHLHDGYPTATSA